MVGKMDEISSAQYKRTMRNLRGLTSITKELNLQEKSRRTLKQESLKRVLDELEDAQKKTFFSLSVSLILDRLKDFAVQIEDINFSNYSKYREELIILYDKKEFLNLLMEKGVKLSNTVLHAAIEYNSINVAYYLVNEHIDKIDINHQDENGNTVLHLALELLCLDKPEVKGIIKLLLSKGIKFDIQNKKSETPFDLLVKYVSYPINQQKKLNNIQELLSNCTVKDILKGLNGTSSLNTLAELAVYHCSEEVLKTLIEGGMNVNCQDENGDTVLHHAFKCFGSEDDEWKEQNITKLLLNEGAKLDIQNKESKTPFDLLVGYVTKAHYTKKERLHHVSRILSNCTIKGTLKSLNGTSSLNELARLAVKLNNKKILNFLIKNDIKILSTILEDIVKYDFNKKIFSYFLHKNRIDYQDEGENTILHHTLKLLISNKSNYQGYVELLMSEGAKLNVKNDKGETPFDLLIEYVEKGFYGQARRLSYVWNLLNKCENKDILRELKYKDGASALDKLNELHAKCRNTSIIVASTLAVAGVALGVAIAAYSGMLAVGIAVGACCLVVAAIIYYCNKPSKSLENSNAEAVVNQITVADIS
ncbi:ankyrin repeat domain-containing protein [Wolbachia endosymbiont (group B) of Hofmannophila pseudospretella]|uniref:ankyrin repeat domain-containing protein n=2 Tax=Wolbachia endosymbiont (group B) of Hofmannophila pseudospretella TaxID=3066177 RepID=UPI00333F7C52